MDVKHLGHFSLVRSVFCAIINELDSMKFLLFGKPVEQTLARMELPRRKL